MSQTSSFSLPIGPVHVALEEPVYFHLDVDGETVRKVEIPPGTSIAAWKAWRRSATSSRTRR